MKKVYLLSERGTNVIFNEVFISREVAENKIKNIEDWDNAIYYDIIELYLNETKQTI